MGTEMSCLLSEFADKIELFKAEIQETCLQVLFSDCCETSGTIGIFDLLDNIKDKAKSVVFVKHHIEMLLGELQFLESFLMDTAEHYIWHQELKDLWACITDIASETKYITDLLLARDNALCYFMLWFPLAMEDHKIIKAKIMEIYDEKRYGIGADNDATADPRRIDDVVIGLEDETYRIIDRLTRGTMRMNIISIVSMGGIGKTTLAQRVYNHPAVVQHFQIRAWCIESVEYQRREILLDILRDVTVVTNRIYDMPDDDLAGVLYNCLKQKRYLIVLDDIWHTKTLDDLRRSFPNDDSGSRIMLTSQIVELAAEADPMARIHFHRFLTIDESWFLFLKKKFETETFDSSLMEVGQRIVEQCRGLPLAIVIMVGVLANTKMQCSYWAEVAETLSSRTRSEVAETLSSRTRFVSVLPVLRVAYDSLPDHLKLCLHYIGELPDRKEIPARKLFRLWIKNGLIKEIESKSLEDVAEECLLDLISRNFVTISRRRCNVRVRACRVHDIVLDLCMSVKQQNGTMSCNF